MAADSAAQLKSREPQRSCIATRERLAPEAMIRFVTDPDGRVVPDLKGVLPGRGAWVRCDAGAVAMAVKRQLFSRAFKQQVRAEADLCDMVDRLLQEHALGMLSLARKAGQAISGFTKVELALRSGRLGTLIHASDAADNGERKLAATLRATGRRRDVAVVRAFTSAQLSLAFGATNVIHAGVLSGGMSESFAMKAGRLQRFRHGEGNDGNGSMQTSAAEDSGVV